MIAKTVQGKPLRNVLNERWGSLTAERASWIYHWQDISRVLLPRNGRFLVTDRNKGDKRHNAILDNTATRALRVMAAGMMAGATSPARPWFRLQAADPDLNRYQPVRAWLDDVAKRMLRVFAKSNTYRALHQVYEELGAFGTAATVVLPDFNNVIHHYTLTAGEYALADDAQNRVCTLFRELEMPIGALVREFGIDNCSDHVKQAVASGRFDSTVKVLHAIQPRAEEERDASKLDVHNMPWSSVYVEQGGENEHVLRISGFDRFPVLAPRWSVTGGDIYGHGPGMEALGDIKQLQHEQTRKAQGIDFQSLPPLQAPTTTKNRDINMLPGGISFVDAATPQGGIRTAFEVRLDLEHLLADIQDVRQRIRDSFFADLFLMMSEISDTTQRTAAEIAARHEEKLTMLGPVLERLHTELLQPLIDITFERLVEADMIPPPPEELQGLDLNVEFVSVLAQAQRAIGTVAIDRLVAHIGQVAQLKPEALDKFDVDEDIDAYSDMLGVDPKLIVAGNKLTAMRDARNKAMAVKEQAAASEQVANTAKSLAGAPTDGKNVLTDVMSGVTGYDSPPAQTVGA